MKVLVKNYREHVIHLSTTRDRVSIPHGHEEKSDNRTVLVPGEELVDDSFLEEARKSPAVQHYFKEGWLRIEEPSEEEETPKPKSNGRK